jgi:hypothetical protein
MLGAVLLQDASLWTRLSSHGAARLAVLAHVRYSGCANCQVIRARTLRFLERIARGVGRCADANDPGGTGAASAASAGPPQNAWEGSACPGRQAAHSDSVLSACCLGEGCAQGMGFTRINICALWWACCAQTAHSQNWWMHACCWLLIAAAAAHHRMCDCHKGRAGQLLHADGAGGCLSSTNCDAAVCAYVGATHHDTYRTSTQGTDARSSEVWPISMERYMRSRTTVIGSSGAEIWPRHPVTQ